jgi:hypothetical protein
MRKTINLKQKIEHNKYLQEQIKDIISLCEEFDFKYIVNMSNETVRISSKIDEWIAEIHSNMNYIDLKHLHRKLTNKKIEFHSQRKYLDARYMLMSIKSHDDYRLTGRSKKVSKDWKFC